MRHEYSNTDLGGALDRAESRRGRLRVYRPFGATGWDQREMDDIRAILDALPEPDQQDDWQECKYADIRKGDRVKRVKKNSYGTISTIEGHATSHDLTGWGTHDHYLAVREDDSQGNITLYRIPTPVQHPDPTESLVIIVHKARDYDFTQTPDGQAMMWNGDTYENAAYAFFCNEITDWTPGKVVANNG